MGHKPAAGGHCYGAEPGAWPSPNGHRDRVASLEQRAAPWRRAEEKSLSGERPRVSVQDLVSLCGFWWGDTASCARA